MALKEEEVFVTRWREKVAVFEGETSVVSGIRSSNIDSGHHKT